VRIRTENRIHGVDVEQHIMSLVVVKNRSARLIIGRICLVIRIQFLEKVSMEGLTFASLWRRVLRQSFCTLIVYLVRRFVPRRIEACLTCVVKGLGLWLQLNADLSFQIPLCLILDLTESGRCIWHQ
jgi:hypothetical protein